MTHKINLEDCKIVKRNGYNAVYMPSHNRAYNDGMVYVHILMAEQKLGRTLSVNEAVHHIDGNKMNNTLTNLMVFASNHDHTLYHQCLNNNLDYALVCTNGVFKCICLSALKKSNDKCPICGKTKARSSKYCQSCYSLLRASHKPSRHVLKQCLKSRNFLSIGKQFGVSDNAVRKWCVSYGLPSKRIDLCMMTDEDIDVL